VKNLFLLLILVCWSGCGEAPRAETPAVKPPGLPALSEAVQTQASPQAQPAAALAPKVAPRFQFSQREDSFVVFDSETADVWVLWMNKQNTNFTWVKMPNPRSNYLDFR
jgi:hypothetical protein